MNEYYTHRYIKCYLISIENVIIIFMLTCPFLICTYI